MSSITVLLLLLGFVLLTVGADVLVKGASGLARAAGIAPVVVGLTVVAFGTSAPEIAVSVTSSLQDKGDLALGNVVGSNTLNVLLILGVAAAIAPLIVHQKLVRFDVPLMLGASFAFAGMSLDNHLGRVDGLLLLVGLGAFLTFAYRSSKAAPEDDPTLGDALADLPEVPTGPAKRKAILVSIGLTLVGLVMLVAGSHWLVEGAVAIATALGVSELVIGLTVVAFGTSLPELAASIAAALRGERDMAVANVVGSNLFNILCVMGIAASFAPNGVPVSPAALNFDIPVMISAAVLCLPIFFIGYRIARWEGWVLLGYYVAYTAYLVLDASGHDALAPYSLVMGLFVIPLTVLTFVVITVRHVRARRRAAST